MKNFAEYLADYVEERHISWRKAAQLCQVDRTLLSRYASGRKLPESMEKVLQIAQGLGMSHRPIEEFQISYQISKGGAYQYMVLGLLSQVFCGQFFQHKPVLPMEQAAEIPQAPFLKRLYGKEEIYSAAARFVQGASYLRLQADLLEAGTPLSQILLGAGKGCRIEHLIGMNHAEKKEIEVKKFQGILPFLCSGREYKAFCSYQWRKEDSSHGSRMQMALSDRGLLLFTADFHKGIFTEQEGYRAYYDEMFQEYLRKSKPYGESGNASQERYQRLEHKGCPFWRLEHPVSGVSFSYQNMYGENIFVEKKGEAPVSFCIEEPELVRMFLKFMGYIGKYPV